jgi:hypothetical protein
MPKPKSPTDFKAVMDEALDSLERRMEEINTTIITLKAARDVNLAHLLGPVDMARVPGSPLPPPRENGSRQVKESAAPCVGCGGTGKTKACAGCGKPKCGKCGMKARATSCRECRESGAVSRDPGESGEAPAAKPASETGKASACKICKAPSTKDRRINKDGYCKTCEKL